MEHDVLHSFKALHRVSPQHLQGHHHSILHYLSVVLEMEDVNRSVIRTGGHQRVLFVETDVRDRLLMELHRLVRLGRKVHIVTD